jgi:hypothetical protein
MTYRLRNVLAMAALSIAFVSCKKDADPLTVNVGTASVLVVNASPDAPALDVRFNDSLRVSSLAYLSSSRQTVTAGNVNVKVSAAGTTTYPINGTLTANANSSYTFFIYDSFSRVRATALADNLAAPPAGKANVRFLNLNPSSSSVDLAIAGGAVLYNGRTFNDQAADASLQTFTAINAGSYTLEVRSAGSSTVLYTLPVVFEPGKIYTVYTRGIGAGVGAQLTGVSTITHN